MVLFIGMPTSSDPSPIGSRSNGIEQDRDDAFLVNEIVDAISFRTKSFGSSNDVATALLAVNEDCRLTLPIFQKCLTTDNSETRKEMVSAIMRSIRDLVPYIKVLNGMILNRKEVNPLNQRVLSSAWYPFNALSVLACWHFFTAEKGSPVAESDSYLDSPVWGIMTGLHDSAGDYDYSLPETLSWAAVHPSVERIKAIVVERGVTIRSDIESLLESQDSVPSPVGRGVL